jgi:hypothetical protein
MGWRFCFKRGGEVAQGRPGEGEISNIYKIEKKIKTIPHFELISKIYFDRHWQWQSGSGRHPQERPTPCRR